MTGLPRDRDAEGRPRNARPRDATGRPLTADQQGVPPVPDLPHRSVGQALEEAQLLVDTGRPFGAHEVLEAMWKQSVEPGERALWRGLAQLMVGLTHVQRGNRVGATALLDRGVQSLAEVRERQTTPVDVTGWERWGAAARDAVAAGAAPLPPPRLHPARGLTD